jgi:hypothetical protein
MPADLDCASFSRRVTITVSENALNSEWLPTPGRASRASHRNHLLNLLATEFDEAHRASCLFDEFLRHETYNNEFCQRLLTVAKQGSPASWEIRRLAVLMLEHQILKLHPDNADDFDFLFTQLNLKEGRGISGGIVSSVLKEGYSTTDVRQFIPEFLEKLARLKRVHDAVGGRKTPDTALRDFIEQSRHDCKLSLARYLFTPEEVVDEILSHLRTTDGARDLDPAQPAFVEDQIVRANSCLPAFEARILRRLCQTSKVYWVCGTTSSEINSLVEYPESTVVLVIKPPGSEIEFEIKRAGRRGDHALSVVYARNGSRVPPSHRLDGGSMQWLLRYEAKAASELSLIYRLVHGTEAPIPHYVSRSTIYSVPVRDAEVQTLRYFTESQVYEQEFYEMRAAMAQSVAAFKAEGYAKLPDLPGDLGLTAQFIGIVAPAQAILSGTSSFRLEKLAAYLSSDGAQRHVEENVAIVSSRHRSRRFADAVMEEILGVYHPPAVKYYSYRQYLAAAFAVGPNRARADDYYLSFVQQITRFWGTLLAVRGFTRGESFVARNVGLKSVWIAGQWQVKIIFMDHDAVAIPGPWDQDFYPQVALESMALDESYIWGGEPPEEFATSGVGYLQTIYRVSDDVREQGQSLARVALRDAYKKTQHALVTNPKLRSLFDAVFLKRLPEWDALVRGYLQIAPDTQASMKWREETRKMLAENGYDRRTCEAYLDSLRDNRAFLERVWYLFTDSR